MGERIDLEGIRKRAYYVTHVGETDQKKLTDLLQLKSDCKALITELEQVRADLAECEHARDTWCQDAMEQTVRAAAAEERAEMSRSDCESWKTRANNVTRDLRQANERAAKAEASADYLRDRLENCYSSQRHNELLQEVDEIEAMRVAEEERRIAAEERAETLESFANGFKGQRDAAEARLAESQAREAADVMDRIKARNERDAALERERVLREFLAGCGACCATIDGMCHKGRRLPTLTPAPTPDPRDAVLSRMDALLTTIHNLETWTPEEADQLLRDVRATLSQPKEDGKHE